MSDASEAEHLLFERVRSGDHQAFVAWVALFRNRLLRVVAFRLDGSLRGQVSAFDLVQEVAGDAEQQLARYLVEAHPAPFLWLRGLTLERINQIHRPLAASCEASAAKLAEFVVYLTMPAHVPGRDEARADLTKHFAKLDALDRELLALRLFELCTEADAATVLGIAGDEAAQRYGRALESYKAAAAIVTTYWDGKDADDD